MSIFKKSIICPACGMEHSRSKECSVVKVKIDGIGYHRICYGLSEEGFGPAVGRCMGCGVRSGHCHHWNCGYEICPSCHQQMISCSCQKEWM